MCFSGSTNSACPHPAVAGWGHNWIRNSVSELLQIPAFAGMTFHKEFLGKKSQVIFVCVSLFSIGG